MHKILILSFLIFTGFSSPENIYYITEKSSISFKSEASQEIIKASSTNLKGALDPAKRTFVFKVMMKSFQGFNSALQQEHFNEKYLETEKYPEATFFGKIIEDIDLSIDGNYELRAKGKLTVHGVEVERIIRSNVQVAKGIIYIQSAFTIVLSDHKVKVPKVVHEKIANEIHIELNAELTRRK